MPIRPELRKYYGAAWRAYRLALIEAHGTRCSNCRREVPAYINLAHLDHDQRSPRVALLCPACHNRHDAARRLAVWRRSRAKRHGQLWLLPEIEWAPFPSWRAPAGVFAVDRQERLF